LVTVNATGPAPTDAGETDTALFEMYTLRSTGAGGRGVVAPLEVEPQAEADRASAHAASIAIVLLHIVAVALLSETLWRNEYSPARRGG
jgi:hypothetical protein